MHTLVDGRYAGLDLAAEPKKTGLAVIAVENARVRVETVITGATDSDITEAATDVAKMGVDVPIGWPQPFVELIAAHSSRQTAKIPVSDKAWRSQFVYRATDVWAQRTFGLRPLSVSADLIAHPALRWVSIEAQLRALGVGCARDGSQRICEVYPAGALKQWGIVNRGYKGTSEKARAQRTVIISSLEDDFSCSWNDYRDELIANDDALDSVIAAIVTAHVASGQAYGPPQELQNIALAEGWMWLPEGVDKQ